MVAAIWLLLTPYEAVAQVKPSQGAGLIKPRAAPVQTTSGLDGVRLRPSNWCKFIAARQGA
jgi:hypothetical protein